MALADVAAMAADQTLQGRITAAAARQGIHNAEAWTAAARWTVCATEGWDAAWQQGPDAVTDDMVTQAVDAADATFDYLAGVSRNA